MSPMRLGFYAAQNTLPAAAPFPVSLMAGTGNVALSRTGNDYYLWQDHGGGEWIRWKLEQFSAFGYTGRTLAACDLMLVSDPIGGGGITRSGTFSATYLTTQTGAYWEFTGTGSSIAMRLVFASNCGIAKVTIDGDATLANMLPTAQEWVDASRLDSTALVANGGTLNPTDRILDQYHSGALTQNQVMFARGLENTSHTVRFTCTGYKRPASSAVRMQYDNSQTELIWWGTGSEDIEDTANVKSSLIRWLYAAVSSAEYAITAWPSGGSSNGFLGGKAHGYENEISLVFTVDGTPVTPSDGQVIAGTEVEVVKHNQLHHPFDADPLADATLTYTLTAEGLDADLDIEWLRNGAMTTSYFGMATWEHMRRDGGSGVWVSFDTTERARWDNEPDFSTGANNDAVHDAPSLTSAISLWEGAAPNYANSWVVGHWVKSIPAITKLWLQDRSGQLDKVYPEIESGAPAGGPFTAGQTLRSSVRYCAKPFTNPGATFGS